MSLTQKRCQQCNSKFTFKSNKAKFCTPNCKSKFYYRKDLEKHKERRKRYRENNKEKIAQDKKRWRQENLEHVREWHRNYDKDRYYSDIQVKLTCVLRSRLNQAIKNNQKSGSAINDLGCTVEELKTYLESKFDKGMNWDNWATDGWHIDHKVPLANFNLENRDELLKACHYTNLQPMWAKDNLSKGASDE